MTLIELQELRATGQFHHATYRNHGSIWEGLYIYRRDSNGFRGYSLEGCFGKDSPDLPKAEDLVRDSGVSFGSYGEG